MNDAKIADATHGIHELIRRRYSPYVFDPERDVSGDDLKALFEAASWAANSYNEQPWRFIIATRDDKDAFEAVLSCLTEGNRKWARNASVVGIGVYKKHFTKNDKPNRVAMHDLGAAAASLTFEATARGLVVHQMAGILPDRARDVYNVPDAFEVATGIAIGYAGDLDKAEDTFRERDSTKRTRKTLDEFVFGGGWETPALD